MLICTCCGKSLTDTEIKYYNDSCESCMEGAHWELQAWRDGEDNPELDAKFDGPKRVLN